MHLSSTDYKQAKLARSEEVGALVEIQNHRIDSPKGTIFVGCSDGDQFKDVYTHHCKVCELDRHHPLCLNGGGLLLSKYSPVRGAKMDSRTLLRHIQAASRIKDMHTVVL